VTDLFLGIIAVSVLAMAVGQVAAVIMAVRAVRQMGETLGRLEQTIRPIVTNVERMSADVARATTIATAQVERVERMMDDVTRRVDETVTAVQDTILGPARSGMAIVKGVKAVLSAFLDRGPRGSRPRVQEPPAPAAEDDASFIG
jgi:uncharacterized protein YoxC